MKTKERAAPIQINLGFSRPEDRRLYEFLKKQAYGMRYPLPTFIILSLQEAFKDRIEEDEVSAIAAEAARKVRERTVTPVVEVTISTPPPALKPAPVSMEQATRQAEAEIAALNPPGMKLKRGKIQPPSN